MNREPYLSKAEYMTVMRLVLCINELDKIIETCKDAGWGRKLKTARTYMHNIYTERAALMDTNAKLTFIKRLKGTKISMISDYPKRISPIVNGGDDLKEITVNLGLLYDLADLALNSCCACEQGKECVDNCYYKYCLMALDVPVQRTDVEDWQCPYKRDDRVVYVNPQHQRMGNLDDKVIERYEEV